MIARIQQLLTLGILACAIVLLIVLWETSHTAAWAVFFGILMSHSIVLAMQFAALPWVNAADAAPRATYHQLLRAWIREAAAAAQVFCWWQPFCARRVPDQLRCEAASRGRRGVVLVHGFLCNRAVWMHWLQELERRQVPFIAVNLEPVFGSIDSYIQILDKAISDMRLATGRPPLLVCHSMGGLAARAWYQASGAQDSAIHGIVTIASPHQGTRISDRFPNLPGLVNANQMRHGSRWLAALAQKETAAQRGRFICYYSNCDNIVMPASTARLEGAENRFVAGLPHVAMALDAGIMRETMALLDDASSR